MKVPLTVVCARGKHELDRQLEVGSRPPHDRELHVFGHVLHRVVGDLGCNLYVCVGVGVGVGGGWWVSGGARARVDVSVPRCLCVSVCVCVCVCV